MDLLTSRLNPSHKRAAFDCGNVALNGYLQQFAKQDEKRRVAACYVMCDEMQKILAYYTLSTSSLPFDNLPLETQKKLPRYASIPTVKIGRLAVELSAQGQGLSKLLLADALKRTEKIEAGVFAITVDAKDENAAGFYLYCGFIALPKQPLTMFLPLSASKVLT